MKTNIAQYEHIVWDWNGTLMDDAWLCVEIVNNLLQRREMPLVNAEEYQETFDIPVQAYYRRLGFDFAVEPYDRLADEFTREYENRKFECTLQNGAADTLKSFEKLGLQQSILTAYQQAKLKEVVEYYDIDRFFTNMVGLNDHYAAGKVENGKKLIQALGLPGDKVLLVGDTLHDFETAQAMGIDCVLIASGHHSIRRLASSEARILDTLADLL
jgi:phosphoglycolate phosphatase